MTETGALSRARRDKAQGKSPSTQAGEFVRDEIEHVRHGVHGARSVKQAIAIGLSKARRAGVKFPKRGKDSPDRKSKRGSRGSSAKRAASSFRALKREGTRSVSRSALARQARASARRRGKSALRRAARKAAATRRRRS